jgi:hypothetical protein
VDLADYERRFGRAGLPMLVEDRTAREDVWARASPVLALVLIVEWCPGSRSAMVDRLRGFLNRPLSDGDRPRLFAPAVALIVGAAAILALVDDGNSSPPSPSSEAATTYRLPDSRPPAAEPVARTTGAPSARPSAA